MSATKTVAELVEDAFYEGMAVGAEDADQSRRPIVGGGGIHGPSDPDVLWRRSDAFQNLPKTSAAPEPADRFFAVTRDIARSA